MNKHPATQATMLHGATMYAAADKSDPFALARALAHLKSEVASPLAEDGGPAYYTAEPSVEKRSFQKFGGEFEEYPVTVYRNIQRP